MACVHVVMLSLAVQALVLGKGDRVTAATDNEGGMRFLLIAGRPIGEPIVQVHCLSASISVTSADYMLPSWGHFCCICLRPVNGRMLRCSNQTETPSLPLLMRKRLTIVLLVQYGPFVMNTTEEIEQAFHDHQRGLLQNPRDDVWAAA